MFKLKCLSENDRESQSIAHQPEIHTQVRP